MTSSEWKALSWTEQKSRWAELSEAEKQAIIEGDKFSTSAPPAKEAKNAAVSTAASAVACYIFAWVSLFAAACYGVAAAASAFESNVYQFGISIASAVLWWAVGDMVSALHRMSAAQAAR